MRFCSNCGKEIQDGLFCCPFCGSSLSGANFVAHERLTEERHNELLSLIAAFFGLSLLILGAVMARASGLGLALVGLLFLFIGSASAFYYSRKRGKILKKLS